MSHTDQFSMLPQAMKNTSQHGVCKPLHVEYVARIFLFLVREKLGYLIFYDAVSLKN